MWQTYCTGFKPNGSIWGMGAQVFQKSISHCIFQELISHKPMQTKIQCKVSIGNCKLAYVNTDFVKQETFTINKNFFKNLVSEHKYCKKSYNLQYDVRYI